MRLKAARKLGLAEVPAVIVDDLTEAQLTAFRLLVNRSVAWAAWDEELLAGELAKLKALYFNLELTGFTPVELIKRTRADPLEELGVAVPEEGPPRTARGDVWILGGHRLMCGDSAKAEDVARLLAGDEPRLCVTDPPYGVEYKPEWRNPVSANPERVSAGKVANDDCADWAQAWRLLPGEVIYAWCPSARDLLLTHGNALVKAGFELRSLIVWAKDKAALGRGDYHHQYEACWYAVREGGKTGWSGARDQTTVWRVANEHVG